MTATAQRDALRPGSGAVRLARSLAAAVCCVLTAAAGHMSAGGELPNLSVVAAFAGSAGVAWLLAARRVTPGQLVGLLVLCQVAVHLSGSSSEMDMSTSMMGAHLIATVVSAVVLARGERFVWRLASRLGLRGLSTVIACRPPLPATGSLPLAASPPRKPALLAYTRVERGPPFGS